MTTKVETKHDFEVRSLKADRDYYREATRSLEVRIGTLISERFPWSVAFTLVGVAWAVAFAVAAVAHAL